MGVLAVSSLPLLLVMLGASCFAQTPHPHLDDVVTADGVNFIQVPEDYDEGTDELSHLDPEIPREKVLGLPKDNEETSFSPPKLSDEEERSPHLPVYLRCDGCYGVAHQLMLGFAYAHRNTKIESDLKSWDVIEAIEETCKQDKFQSYGITEEASGRKRIRGPGLDSRITTARISQMGGKWPFRLLQLCQELTGIFEDKEMDLYRAWKADENKNLDNFLCHNPDIKLLDSCIVQVEQPELDRRDIEDMISTMEKKRLKEEAAETEAKKNKKVKTVGRKQKGKAKGKKKKANKEMNGENLATNGGNRTKAKKSKVKAEL